MANMSRTLELVKGVCQFVGTEEKMVENIEDKVVDGLLELIVNRARCHLHIAHYLQYVSLEKRTPISPCSSSRSPTHLSSGAH